MVLSNLLKWVTSSETRPHITLKSAELDTLTDEYIKQRNYEGLAAILKELEYRKFTKVAGIKQKIESCLLDLPNKTASTDNSKESRAEQNKAQGVEKGSTTEEDNKPAKITPRLQANRKVRYVLIEEDSETLYTPIRDHTGITIRLNKNNSLGQKIYNQLTLEQGCESRYLAFVLEALAEIEIGEVGTKKNDMAMLRRKLGKIGMTIDI